MIKIIGLLLISFCFCCQNGDTNKSQQRRCDSTFLFNNKWDTIKISIRNINSLKRVYLINNQLILEDIGDSINNSKLPIDSYEDIKGNKLHIRSYKIDSLLKSFFSEINLKYPVKINKLWLDSVEKYNDRSLPRKFLLDILNPYKDSVIYTFHIQTVNIDDDINPEKIIELQIAQICIVVILDYEKNEWYCKTRIELGLHLGFPVIKVLNLKSKIIKYDYESGWGTGYFRNSTRLYRFINGKTYLCIDFPTIEGSYYKFGTIWQEINSQPSFFDGDSIRIDYTYNLYSGEFIGEKEVPILYNKKESVFYKWDNTNKKYIVYSATNNKLYSSDEVWSYTFQEIYKDKIDSVSKHGTEKQKQAFIKRFK